MLVDIPNDMAKEPLLPKDPLNSEHVDYDDAPPPFPGHDANYNAASSSSNATVAGPSTVPSGSTLARNINESIPVPGGEEAPPQFTPYEAEFFEVGDGDIVSHDPHLNSDGEALFRFLLSQSATPPSYRLHCRGTHVEHRTRWVNVERNGRWETRHETYTETITDFDFRIDIGQHIVAAPVHWSVGDGEAVYRGGMVREVDPMRDGRRAAIPMETRVYKDWVEERTARGVPPWVPARDAWREGAPEQTDARSVLRSSKTLREWADEYCASPKYLKEFVYEKVVYGWNVQELENAVRLAISSAPYSGDISVNFEYRCSKIYVRPDNWLSRTLSNKWLKFLLWILLIYPFIWLFKRFHSRGGGRWEVCGGAYALKRWVPVGAGPNAHRSNSRDGLDPKPLPPGDDSQHNRTIDTPDGQRELVGVREGEWFRVWHHTIINAVANRFQSSQPLYVPTGSSVVGMLLDGY
ncbi:hypothetical protein HGRIS_007948 [Hohenbuehelia grisea]|uniref:Uncharacterized protein n=1 Tax=Hohenbuehelia grisea TaxID=104357 RepID=A0ABR3J6U8_9AGAR